MKISIALATYNGEKYIQEQLESIINQTRSPDEVVVTDDGSVDSTLKILNKFKKEVSFPCHILINVLNKGAAFSFKQSIDFCNGDIIVFCDQDDFWLPNKLERIEKEFKESPSIDYIISNANIVNQNSMSLGYTLWKQRGFSKYWRNKFLKGNQFEVLLRKNITTGMTTAISKRVADFGAKKPEHVIHDAWYIYIASISGMKGALINESLINYRQHESQQFGALKYVIWKRAYSALNNNYKSIETNLSILRPLFDYAKDNIKYINQNNSFCLIEKLEHYKSRKLIVQSKFSNKIIKILREISKGSYMNYSSWKNILFDLVT